MTTTLLKLQIQAQNAEAASKRNGSATNTPAPAAPKRNPESRIIPSDLARPEVKTASGFGIIRSCWSSTASFKRITFQFNYQSPVKVNASSVKKTQTPKQKHYFKARIQRFFSMVTGTNAPARILPEPNSKSNAVTASARVKETIAHRVTKAMENCLWCFETPVL